MPYGGNDWLEQTVEETLEPDLPICDPHHHFWDYRLERLPYQRYLLHELQDDIDSGHNITSTVFVEARAMYRKEGPDSMKPLGELEFVQGLAAASDSGLYGNCKAAAAIIGHANLNLGKKVQPVLEALQATSSNRFKGIRHSVTWDPHPEFHNNAQYKIKGQLKSTDFINGARLLESMGLTFEAWLYFHQLPELVHFAKSVPNLTIILNHVGGLIRQGPYANSKEVIDTWKKGIALVAECPNISIKLGGLGMPICGFDWHQRDIPIGSHELSLHLTPYFDYCIEQFGPSRSMFESNFPVDKVSYSYHILYNAFKRYSKRFTRSERAAMFHDNAVRIYSINLNGSENSG